VGLGHLCFSFSSFFSCSTVFFLLLFFFLSLMMGGGREEGRDGGLPGSWLCLDLPCVIGRRGAVPFFPFFSISPPLSPLGDGSSKRWGKTGLSPLLRQAPFSLYFSPIQEKDGDSSYSPFPPLSMPPFFFFFLLEDKMKNCRIIFPFLFLKKPEPYQDEKR